MTDFVRQREVVVPGQVLSDDARRAGKNTYVFLGKVYSSVLGLVVERGGKLDVIAAKSPYVPSKRDPVLGIISDIKPNIAEVDLGWHLIGLVRLVEGVKQRRKKADSLSVGDVIYTHVKYSGVRGIFLEGSESLKKIERGMLVWINPAAVPRLVGRHMVMLNVLKEETSCEIYVGRNGLVAIIGPDSRSEFAAMSAIKLIESESHIQGLKEKVIHHVRKLMLRYGEGIGGEAGD